LNRNYGNVLIIYDRLFGSFQEELTDVPPKFGITNNINTYNIITVIFHEWKDMWKDLKNKRTSS
ncbi:MAG: sterol desaturase family protein, partial [Balneola sp.]